MLPEAPRDGATTPDACQRASRRAAGNRRQRPVTANGARPCVASLVVGHDAGNLRVAEVAIMSLRTVESCGAQRTPRRPPPLRWSAIARRFGVVRPDTEYLCVAFNEPHGPVFTKAMNWPRCSGVLACEQLRAVSSFSLRSVSDQVEPMTRVLRAASTRSLMMMSGSIPMPGDMHTTGAFQTRHWAPQTTWGGLAAIAAFASALLHRIASVYASSNETRTTKLARARLPVESR